MVWNEMLRKRSQRLAKQTKSLANQWRRAKENRQQALAVINTAWHEAAGTDRYEVHGDGDGGDGGGDGHFLDESSLS